jgi:hypothetical protein
MVPESFTLAELYSVLKRQKMLLSKKDRSHFWLFRQADGEEECLMPGMYVGELLNSLPCKLVLRRRIFSPYYKYKLAKLSCI